MNLTLGEAITLIQALEAQLSPKAQALATRLQEDSSLSLQVIIEPKTYAGQVLSIRQLDILKLSSEGFNNPEIAFKMNYSVSTIKREKHTILGKLDARSMMEALLKISSSLD